MAPSVEQVGRDSSGGILDFLGQARAGLRIYHWIWLVLCLGGALLVAAPRLLTRPVIYTTEALVQIDVTTRYRELYQNGKPDADFAAVEYLALELLRVHYPDLGLPTLSVRYLPQPDGRIAVAAIGRSPSEAQALANEGAEALARSVRGAGGREILRNMLGWELARALQGRPTDTTFQAFLREIIRTAIFPLNRAVEPLSQAITVAELAPEDRSDLARALEIRESQITQYELPAFQRDLASSPAPQSERDLRRITEGLQAIRGALRYLYMTHAATFVPDTPSAAFRASQAPLPVAPVDQQAFQLFALTALVGLLFGGFGVAIDRSAGALEKIRELWGCRELIRNLVLRDLRSRYKGSALGYLWTQLAPLMLMGVFWLVFSVFFKSGIAMFPVFLIIGLLSWNYCAEAVGSGSRSILENASLIKKVFFPREVLPLVSVFSSLLNFLLSLPMLLLVMVIVQLLYPPLGGRLNFQLTIAYLPVILLIQTIFLVGVAFFLSAVAVFFRDTIHLIGILLQFWFFLSPVVYALDTISTSVSVRLVRWLNPMASIIEFYREILYGNSVEIGQVPTPGIPALTSVLRVFLTALATLSIGYWTFRRTSGRFGEEI